MSEQPLPDFYVEEGCCTTCGVPQMVAPELVGWANEEESYSHCVWIKQPETELEFQHAVQIFQGQELGCHRYRGTDPVRIAQLGPKVATILHPSLLE